MVKETGGEDATRRELVERILRAMIPYVEGWVTTLGTVGSPLSKENTTGAGISGRDRATAAKTGLEMVTKLIGSGASPTGGDLLKHLQELESIADVPDDGEAGDRPPHS